MLKKDSVDKEKCTFTNKSDTYDVFAYKSGVLVCVGSCRDERILYAVAKELAAGGYEVHLSRRIDIEVCASMQV